jgi:hypothetical protein
VVRRDRPERAGTSLASDCIRGRAQGRTDAVDRADDHRHDADGGDAGTALLSLIALIAIQRRTLRRVRIALQTP